MKAFGYWRKERKRGIVHRGNEDDGGKEDASRPALGKKGGVR
jgi:hypothetical protein